MKDIPQKILIIRYGAIGDVVHTTNVFRSIKRKYPNTEIHYLTFKTPASLLVKDPDLNKVIITNKNDLKFFKSKSLIKDIKSEKYDLAINLQPNFKTKLLLYRSRIKNVVNYKKDYKLHAVTNFWGTAKKTLPDITCPNDLSLHLDEEVESQITSKISQYKRPFIVISAGGTKSPRQGRCYPINKWLEVGQKLQAKYNGTIFITGLDEDSELLSNLNDIPNSVNFVGRLSLQELASLFKNSDLLLSGDSGPLHIATAVGTKVVGLYGSMMISRTGPFGTGHKAIKAEIPCIACNRRKCKYPKFKNQTYQNCMQSISVNEILNASSTLLKNFIIS